MLGGREAADSDEEVRDAGEGASIQRQALQESEPGRLRRNLDHQPILHSHGRGQATGVGREPCRYRGSEALDSSDPKLGSSTRGAGRGGAPADAAIDWCAMRTGDSRRAGF